MSILKYETKQMNTSTAWFAKVYPDAKVTRVMVIPTKKVSRAAAFHLEFDTVIMRKKGLDDLVKNVRAFFAEFRDVDMKSICERARPGRARRPQPNDREARQRLFERPTTA